MKKKVALLLVLVMILSALPMNVFGDTPVRWNLAGASVSGHFVDRNDTQDITVRLPLQHVFGGLALNAPPVTTTNELRLIVDVYHANFSAFMTSLGLPDVAWGNNGYFTSAHPDGVQLQHALTPNAASALPTANITAAAFDVRLMAVSGSGDHRSAIVQITWLPQFGGESSAAIHAAGAVIGGLDFTLSLTSRNHGDWTQSRMSVSDQTGGAGVGEYIRNWPLAIWQDGSVIIDVNGGARGFSSQLHLNQIRVRENRYGVLPETATLRLEAPAFYSWAFLSPENVPVQPLHAGANVVAGRTGSLYRLTANGIGSIGSPTITAIRTSRGAGTHGLHVVYITVNLPRNLLRPLTGGFQIQNLWLVPDYNAPSSGNVYVNALLGQWVGAVAETGAGEGHFAPVWTFNRWESRAVDWNAFDDNAANVWGTTMPTQGAPGAPQPLVERIHHSFSLTGGFWEVLTASAGARAWSSTNPALPPATATRQVTLPVTEVPARVEANNPFAGQYVFRVPNTSQYWAQHDPARPTTATEQVMVSIPGGVAHVRWVYGGNVIERITGQQWVPGTPGTPGAQGRFEYTGQWRIGHSGYRARLHVGTRGAAQLQASVYNIPYMRTGHLGLFRCAAAPGATGVPCIPAATRFATVDNIQTGMQNLHIDYPMTRNVPWNRDNGGIPHFTGVATGSLIIEETIPGGFLAGFGAPIHFQFLDEDGNQHPGIQLLGVQARAGNRYIGRYREWYNNGFRNFHYGTAGIATNGERDNWMSFVGWLGALDQRLPVVPGVGRLSPDQVTIYMPMQTITDTRPAGPGALEIRFFLSLEAGFEWKYGRNVDVTISGPAVAHLPMDQRVQTIGYAIDPIITNVTDNYVALEVEGGTLYNVARAPLADVTVDIVNPNAFTVGSELWVYISEDYGPAPSSSLSIVGVPTLSVANSNMRFSPGQREGDRVVFSVTRAPDRGEEPTLTISGINVSGIAYPDVDYRIVVSGTGIANNDMSVFLYTFGGQGNPAQLRTLARGVFTTLPYHGVALTNDGEGRWEGAPGYDAPPEPPAPPQPPHREYRLQEGVPFGGVAEPLIWHIVGRNRVGMVSMRAFAVLIGASDDQIVWNSETRVAEVRGQHFNGETVGVAVQMGNTNATVVIGNAAPQTVDIATAVNFLSGPAGTVEPLNVNNHVYLPLRFMAETFGFTVERQGNIVIFR